MITDIYRFWQRQQGMADTIAVGKQLIAKVRNKLLFMWLLLSADWIWVGRSVREQKEAVKSQR